MNSDLVHYTGYIYLGERLHRNRSRLHHYRSIVDTLDKARNYSTFRLVACNVEVEKTTVIDVNSTKYKSTGFFIRKLVMLLVLDFFKFLSKS